MFDLVSVSQTLMPLEIFYKLTHCRKLIIIARFDDWNITKTLFIDSREKDILMLGIDMIKFSITILIIRIIE